MPRGKAISNGATASPSPSMTKCTNANRGAAQYVYDMLKNLPDDSQWTITIRQGKLEGCAATTVIIESSEGIQTQSFSDEWLATLKKGQDGSSPKNRNGRRKNLE